MVVGQDQPVPGRPIAHRGSERTGSHLEVADADAPGRRPPAIRSRLQCPQLAHFDNVGRDSLDSGWHELLLSEP